MLRYNTCLKIAMRTLGKANFKQMISFILNLSSYQRIQLFLLTSVLKGCCIRLKRNAFDCLEQMCCYSITGC
jgi:hypothetical protein